MAPSTGHQHHFLSRLDRISVPHVELALRLYRDHDLVRFILGKLSLPERAPRVAFSLAHAQRGPFLIVTREGRFVTCLGEGMTPGPHPIVPRAELDRLTGRVDAIRACFHQADSLRGNGRAFRNLLAPVLRAGPYLSREQFDAVAVFHPLIGARLLSWCLRRIESLEAWRWSLLRIKANRPRGRTPEVMRAYWRAAWAVGHLAALSMADDGELVRAVVADAPDPELLRATCSAGPFRQHVPSIALRGAWAAARAGSLALPAYTKYYREAASPIEMLEAACCLLAIAMKDPALAREIRPTLAAPRPPTGAPAIDAACKALQSVTLDVFRASQRDRELAWIPARVVGGHLAHLLTRHRAPGAAHRYERLDDVPVDLAISLAANHHEAGARPDAVFISLLLASWAGTVPARQLYLPGAFLAVMRRTWTPLDTMRLLEPWRRSVRRAAVRPEIARKGPCPCGSGEKYKRCCEGRRCEIEAPRELAGPERAERVSVAA
jgi:hypothetical protein